MKYPCLVPKWMCKTDIEVSINPEGRDEYGEPFPPVEWKGKANYQDKAKEVFENNKEKIIISGSVYVPGDIAPTLPTISAGSVLVNGVKRRLYQGTKCRNPDGTVNYCILEVE